MDRINSGGYDLPDHMRSHVQLAVNSISDGSPMILVHTALFSVDRTVSFLFFFIFIVNCEVAWWCSGKGIGLVINRLRVRFPAVHCRVGTWMGDRL